MKPIDVLFDGPPGPEGGRFVEVEIDGRSINAGKWEPVEGLWRLRINTDELPGSEVTRLVAENLVLRHRLEDLRFQLHVAKTAAISGAIALALLIGGIIHG